MVTYKRYGFSAALLLAAIIAVPSNSALAGSSTADNKPVGRFVAIAPPAGGQVGYPNFLWVLDTTTGKVLGYHFVETKDAQGNHEAWITEQLLTREEYMRINTPMLSK
jgi:hypothetical protein